MRSRRVRATAALLVATLTAGLPLESRAGESVERAGDVFQFLLPLGSVGYTLARGDAEGTRQAAHSIGATLATTWLLKVTIDARRPNGGNHSFPSGHTAAAMSGAAFLTRRYGLRIGLPAIGLASFVAYSRVEADAHHPRDVVAGAALSFLSAMLLVEPYDGLAITPQVEPGYLGLGVRGTF